MFISLEKPLLLMLLLLLLISKLLLFVLLLFCNLLSLLLKNSCWPKLLAGSKPNRSLLIAFRPLLTLSWISSARGSKSLSESEFSSSSSIFWLLLLPPMLIWLERLFLGGTIGKKELGDEEWVDAVVELVSISSLSSSGRQWFTKFFDRIVKILKTYPTFHCSRPHWPAQHHLVAQFWALPGCPWCPDWWAGHPVRTLAIWWILRAIAPCRHSQSAVVDWSAAAPCSDLSSQCSPCISYKKDFH